MENPKTELAAKLKDANNVLVTVSTNPSVDQLAAAIGLTLFLSKLKKHATTVFSGQVPSTIDFLKPEETIETTTDSLRDFIIALDKNKADKIRYKVEENMVKIFITPYRTSIGEQDLVFSQGDFNVDVVVALGVHNREDLDQAITSHGRILHDATVATVNTRDGSDIGTLNWVDAQASSLCEMAVALADLMQANSLDGQMATAFLTGIVAETERFSNEKTTSTTMSASAKLMAAGANQQLVATKLQPPEDEPPVSNTPPGPEGGDSPNDINIDEDGSLRIDHDSGPGDASRGEAATPPIDTLPEPVLPDEESPNPEVSQVKIDDDGQLQVDEPKIKRDNRRILDKPPKEEPTDMLGAALAQSDDPDDVPAGAKLVTEPPQFGGKLSAAIDDASDEPSPLNLPAAETPLLSHDSDGAKQDEKSSPTLPSGDQSLTSLEGKTLNDIEEAVDSPHVKETQPEQSPKSSDNAGSALTGSSEATEPPKPDQANQARNAVTQAINASGDGNSPLPPLESVGSSGAVEIDHQESGATEPQSQTPSSQINIDDKGNLSFAQSLANNSELPKDVTAAPVDEAGAPPTVPPPMMPPLGPTGNNSA